MIIKYNKFNESIKDKLKGKSEEEVDIAWKNKYNDLFERSIEKSWTYIDNDLLGENWKIYTKEYHLYNQYYIYKSKVLEFNSNREMEVVTGDINKFINFSKNKINEIEKAIKKLKDDN